MKLLIIISLFIYSVNAQVLPGGKTDRYEDKREVSKNDDRAFFGLGVGILEINTFTGVEGTLFFGVIKKSNLIIGGGIHATLFDSFKVGKDNNSFLKYTNGFVNLGYFLKLSNVVKVSPNLALGIGRFNTSNNQIGIVSENNGDWYYFLEPNIAFDFKVFKKSHINLELSYRNYFDVEDYGLDNSKVNSLCYKINYKMIIE